MFGLTMMHNLIPKGAAIHGALSAFGPNVVFTNSRKVYDWHNLHRTGVDVNIIFHTTSHRALLSKMRALGCMY